MASRARQSTAAPTPRRTGNELPQYERPSFPLNPNAQRALDNLVRAHSLKKLDQDIKHAQEQLSHTAAEINDRVTTKAHVAERKRKAPTDGPTSEDAAANDGVEKSLEELRDKVERMTRRMDESIRKLIDGQSSVQAMKTAVDAAATTARANASTQASTQAHPTQRRRRNTDDEEEDDDDDEYQDFTPTDPRGGTQAQKTAIETFRAKLEDEKIRYESQTMTKRYTHDDSEYRTFRRMVHDAQHGQDVPLPDPREWFEDGEAPAPGVTTRSRNAASDGEDSDDDIAVSRMTISTKCPLTLVEFNKPLTSKKCPHSFEGEAILELIRNSVQREQGRSGEKIVQCPVPGCSQILTKNDLHTDPVLIRQIKRIQRTKELQDGDDDESDGGARNGTTVIDDDGAADIDDVIEGRTQIKGEQRSTRVPSTAPPRTPGVVELGSETETEEDDDVTMDED